VEIPRHTGAKCLLSRMALVKKEPRWGLVGYHGNKEKPSGCREGKIVGKQRGLKECYDLQEQKPRKKVPPICKGANVTGKHRIHPLDLGKSRVEGTCPGLVAKTPKG